MQSVLLCMLINQYEDLGNFYYLRCFKPNHAAFDINFTEMEKN